MTGLAALTAAAAADRLFVSGGFHPEPGDGAPEGCGTLLLLSPDEPGFWPHVTSQPEFADGAANPMDRWSARVISALAHSFGGQALFPFGGPPWHPFYTWALRSGRAWAAPVTLLVHDRMGLFASYRGALAVPGRWVLPQPPSCPCDGCARPCLTACPASALGAAGYDVAACHAHLDRPEGKDCLSAGCVTRRACPASIGYGRLGQQSAWHMRQFHK